MRDIREGIKERYYGVVLRRVLGRGIIDRY